MRSPFPFIALSATLFLTLSASAATVTSVTIEGPDAIDIQNSTSVAYATVAHWSDGSSTVVTSEVWSSSHPATVALPRPALAVANALGTATISASVEVESAGVFTPTKAVSVFAGAPQPWQAISMTCASEDTSGLSSQQPSRIHMGRLSDALPACDARMVVGNVAVERVQILDVRTNAVIGSTPLVAAPGVMRQIPGTPHAIVAIEAGIGRLDLATGSIDYVAIAGTIRDIAPGEPGEVLVLHSPSGSDSSDTWLAVVDLASLAVVADRRLPEEGVRIAYDAGQDRLYMSDYGSLLVRYDYDADDRTFTLSQRIHDSGLDGRALALSPDGLRLAYAAGTEEGTNHAHDLVAANLVQRHGRWRIGWHPVALDFRPDGHKLLGRNANSLSEFDARHVVERTWPLDTATSPCRERERVRYSPSGYLGYATAPCSALTTNPFGAYSTLQVVALGPPVPHSPPPAVRAAALRFECPSEVTGALRPRHPATLTLTDIGTDLVAGCDGLAVVALGRTNRLETIDTRTGVTIGSVPLPASPHTIHRLAGTGILFVLMDSNFVARVDPRSGSATYYLLDHPPKGIVGGEPGQLFVTFRDHESLYGGDQVAVLDSATGARLGTGQVTRSRNLLRYDPLTRALILTNELIPPPTLARYQYDPATFSFSLQHQSGDLGSNSRDLALSPDFESLVFVPHAGGTLHHLSSRDLQSSLGQWPAISGTRSADFRPDGGKLLVGDPEGLAVFDVATHALDKRYAISHAACRYSPGFKRARYSPSGRVGFALCTYEDWMSALVALNLGIARADVVPDFDGSGRSDLLFEHGDGRAAIWLMEGMAATTGAEILGPSTGWSVSHTADFDADGKSDVVWRHADGRMAIYLMNGTSPTATQQLLNAGSWSVTHTPDLDGDGRADLLFQNSDGMVAAWTMNGTTPSGGATLMPAGTGWSVNGTADLDGDGMQDLIWKHLDGRHALWLMSGIQPKAMNQTLGPGDWTVTSADLDGDGKFDLILEAGGGITAWLMDGLSAAATAELLDSAPGWRVKLTGDFNGDGRADLVGEHADGRAVIWLMDGLTRTNQVELVPAGTGWAAVRVQDLDGDGKADIVWQHGNGAVAVWLMDGVTLAGSGTILGPGTGWTISLPGL